MVAVFLAAAAAFSYRQKTTADVQRTIAEQKTKDAQLSLSAATAANQAREEALQNATKARDEAVHQSNIATQQRAIAEERLRVARSQAIASESRRESRFDISAALRRSVLAFGVNRSDEAKAALFETLTRAAFVRRFIFCPVGEFATTVRFSHTSNNIFAFSCYRIGSNSTIHVGTGAGVLTARIRARGDVRDLSFLDADTIVLSGTQTLQVIDLRSGMVHQIAGHAKAIAAVAAFPEAGVVLSGDGAGEVRAWSRRDKAEASSFTSRVIRPATGRPITIGIRLRSQ
ncbi:MAG TPA: hypothetical protein VEX68_21490 [Bryobacteraceae bacterium]|nr:hypothetical protein [Bryobacteraceae bacterium]